MSTYVLTDKLGTVLSCYLCSMLYSGMEDIAIYTPGGGAPRC